MALPDYSYLYDHACERKGGEKALKALLPKTKSTAHLKKAGLGSLSGRVHPQDLSVGLCMARGR